MEPVPAVRLDGSVADRREDRRLVALDVLADLEVKPRQVEVAAVVARAYEELDDELSAPRAEVRPRRAAPLLHDSVELERDAAAGRLDRRDVARGERASQLVLDDELATAQEACDRSHASSVCEG